MSSAPGADRSPILFVEDDDAVCRVMTRSLARIGIEAVVARSAEEALRLVSHQFGAIVTDHHMPGMSGVELIARLVAEHPAVATKIILTSGDIDSETTRQAISAFGCRGLAKPYTTAELALAIRAATAPAGKALTAA